MRFLWSIIDLRRTSVGCAVSTGATSAWSSSAITASRPMPSALQPPERRGDVGVLLGLHALAILGQVGEHREEHEAAREIERLVQRQPVEPAIHRACPRDAARAIDRGGADIFDALEQLLAAIGTDYVAEEPTEEANILVICDREASHGARCCTAKCYGVNAKALGRAFSFAFRLSAW